MLKKIWLLLLIVLLMPLTVLSQYKLVRSGAVKSGEIRVGSQKKVIALTLSKADTFYVYNTNTVVVKWKFAGSGYKVLYGYDRDNLVHSVEVGDSDFAEIPVKSLSKVFVQVEETNGKKTQINLLCVLPYKPSRDIDRDGKITPADFRQLMFFYGGRIYADYSTNQLVYVNYYQNADLFYDGIIDDVDVRIFLKYYEIEL